MAENAKMTKMELKVDLQCHKCYKKVKKVLCKFPEIQDQAYDEKNNKVMIKVVSCCPERIRDKLYCKGQGFIKCIEILPPPQTQKQPDPTPEKQPGPKPQKQPEPKPQKQPDPPPPPLLVPVPVKPCCNECYERRGGGPCYQPCYGYWAPIMYYDGYCGRPVYDSWGGGCGCGCGGGYYGCPCRGYYYEQNQSGCSIM